MGLYCELAPFYDRLNTADYDGTAAFLTALFARFNIPKGALLLDLACGTGKLTRRFAKAGYDMIGVDLSPEMLAEAGAAGGEGILYLCQDMRALDLYGTVDACFCLFDSLNYLPAARDLDRVFSRLKHFIAPGGLFVFDLNTREKFKRVYADNCFVFEEDGLFCTWQNHYDPRRGLCDFDLTFFVREKNGAWRRSDEHQRERLFSQNAVKKALAANGFSLCDLYGSTDFSPARPDDTRLYYIARREKE